MRLTKKLLCFAQLCFTAYILGQNKPPVLVDTAPPPSTRFPASWYPADSDSVYTPNPEKNAPYIATLVTTGHYRNQSTGEIITHSTSTLQARDAEGRQRDETEMPRPDGHGGTIKAHEVTVSDPVSHCNFRWMEPWAAPGKPTAIVTCMPRTLRYINQNTWANSLVAEPKAVHQPDGATFFFEPLGKRMFGDVEAEGVRNTKTITMPQTGEVRKLVTEIWYSQDLKELIVMRELPDVKYPQNSQIPDFELTNIQRVEPSLSLFYPPPEYDIVSAH